LKVDKNNRAVLMIVSKLELGHRQAFMRMLEDYDLRDPQNGGFYARGREDFPAYVQSLEDEEHGINIRPGWVPCSHRWLLDDTGAIVGIVRVRHNLNNPFLAEEIGHIGYDVPPSYRGQGYGIACLQAGLDMARTLQLKRVLVCADTDNPASWRVIEHCGGVLEVERYSPHYKKLFRRYWIETKIDKS
jgi:predicted acetyltransferase